MTAEAAHVKATAVLCSMATRHVLEDLAREYGKRSGRGVSIRAIGGVDAARRVQEGVPFDVAVLAADVLAKLEASGAVLAGSRMDLARSAVAVAVPAGASHPDIGSEAAVRQAVLEAQRIGYSTGPSGNELLRLFERWGIAEEIHARLVQAPPGVPVAALLARGEVTLGFQQLSELVHESGIDVLGTLPAPIAAITIFSGGVCTVSTQRESAREFLAFAAAPAADAAKRRHGMQPATSPGCG